MYDFTLGANVGMFSQQNRFQRAQTAFEMGANSPITMQDMGRRWELENEVYLSMGFTESQVRKFIGPREAVGAGTAVPPDEAIAQIIQGNTVRIHPADNNQEFIDYIDEFMSGPQWEMLGQAYEIEIRQFRAQHENAIIQKMRQQEMAQQQAMQGPPEQQPGGVGWG